jgi:hypothetical protein
LSDPYSIIELSKEKDKQMNVVVQNLDNSQIHPSYAPEHKDSVMAFYSDLVAKGSISGYVIRFDNGSVVAEGKVL